MAFSVQYAWDKVRPHQAGVSHGAISECAQVKTSAV